MTVLNSTTISALRNEGKLVIEPFSGANLGPNSYDLTLGENFYILDPRIMTAEGSYIAHNPDRSSWGHLDLCSEDRAFQPALLVNPYSKDDTAAFRLVHASPWDDIVSCAGIKRSAPAAQVFKSSDLVFLLPPHATVFGHTMEFAGSACAEFCTMLRSRSSWARVGVSFTGGAGWGDSGFFGRWGLRIVNHTPHAISLLVGSRVAQLVFLRTEGEDGGGYRGKYQEITDLEELKRSWRPESLLPQLWKDLVR